MITWTIRFQGVGFHYGNQWVLYDTSFEAHAGQVLGFRGRNGTGKSTLLRLAAGLIRPHEGQVIWNDQLEERKRGVGAVFSSSYLYDQLTVLENLQFYGSLYRLDGKVIKERIEELMDQFDLQNVLHEFAGQLSKGYTQRVSLARALLHQPPLLLFDEPFDGLDLESQQILTQAIFKEKARGCTIFLVSHDMGQLDALSDRHFLVEGKKVREMEREDQSLG
ncbi:ABC transporter ATP-binding protein [Microaerobacter geothermalis]|uniref:ABC transporter ATP-binding protein n=1 Tax=Microaerobacter geothermalis TaxID=674972 RepID=UPI001F2E6BD1|nr:ABC transporter ATP-binding protein [Microaerobacter geothermalis]MCF6092546.1 ABC transporter ATP-binding protein [Microaerobacter geothermalis]